MAITDRSSLTRPSPGEMPPDRARVPLLLTGEPVPDLDAAMAQGAGQAITLARERGRPVISELSLSRLRGDQRGRDRGPQGLSHA